MTAPGAGSAAPTGRCLVLVGLPGAGSSTVGALVAGELGLPLRDTDEIIATTTGMSAAELLLTHGEQAYRDAEAAAAAAALAAGPAVVALGSGALSAGPGIAGQLAAHDVVWLRVTVPNAISRAGLNVPRPAALGNIRATFAAMAAEREPGYAAIAAKAVDTDYRPPAEVASEVLAWWDGSRSSEAGMGSGDGNG